MLRAQHLPGIESSSDKGGGWGTFGSLQYLRWVLDEVLLLGTAVRKAQQWLCRHGIFQAYPSTIHLVQMAAVQPLVFSPEFKTLLSGCPRAPHELNTAFAAERQALPA